MLVASITLSLSILSIIYGLPLKAFANPTSEKMLPNSLSMQRRVLFNGGSTETIPELKPPPMLYSAAVETGIKKASLPALKIFLLGILGGCHIGFGAFLSLAVGGSCPDIALKNPGLQKIIQGAFGLPFGLMMVLMGGAELFTGNTAIVTTSMIEKRITLKNFFKNWICSYLGNFVGSIALAYLVYYGGTLKLNPVTIAAATTKTSLSFLQAFIRGLLCNWLVCMAVYMANGASSASGKMVAIWFPISAFIALSLEHSVANMFIIPLGMLHGADISIKSFLLKNLLPVTLGNIVGGAGCVAAMYSSIFGSLFSTPTVGSSSTSNHPNVITTIRGGSATPISSNKKLGTDYLPAATVARAQEGNMFEKVKLKKDGTKAWTDVHEFAAAIRAGTLNWEDVAQDDIDIRLKWSGMFHRKKATPGKFMMRLRVPNGILNSTHMRYYADVVRPYGPDIGVVDITTRQNIQLRGMPLEDGSDIIKGLQQRGQTCLMSGMDNVRNMVGSPIAGIDPLEIYDTRRLTKELDQWYTGDGYGNPEWGNLPRKFNIAISGSRDDFAHTNINDIGLRPVLHARTMEMGFNVVLGGYMSIKRVAESIPMNVWIPESAVLPFCKSILRIFRDEGFRGDRQKARMMWLIEDWGLEKFKDTVLQELQNTETSWKDITSFETSQPYLEEWTHGHREVLGVNPQKQNGKSWVGIHVPVGRLSADECLIIAELADKYSDGEIRLTVEQNIILPNVDNEKLNDLLAEPGLTGQSRLSVNPGNLIGRLVSCTGAQFCPVALVETKLPIDTLVRKLEDSLNIPHPVRIHMTGCPNSCGQVCMYVCIYVCMYVIGW